MLTERMARLDEALEALQRFQSNDDDANRDYFRPFELALYEAVQDGALDLLDHLRDAARACERRGRAAPPPLASTRADLRRALDELDALRSEVGYEDGDHAAIERDLLDEIATLARAVVDGGAE